MLLEVPPRSPSPCFESPCLFLKVFLVRPLRPCYCSWADVRSPFSPPALLWFGGTALPPRAWARGAEGQCRGHVCFPSAPTLTGVPNRAPPAPDSSPSLPVLSPLWGLELPWSSGFAFFSFRSAFFSASHHSCLFLTPILILTCTRRLTPVFTGATTCHLLQRGG